jgi:hypothetical protein
MIYIFDPVPGDEAIPDGGLLLWHEGVRAGREVCHSFRKLQDGGVHDLETQNVTAHSDLLIISTDECITYFPLSFNPSSLACEAAAKSKDSLCQAYMDQLGQAQIG